jgi:hypothetical protein
VSCSPESDLAVTPQTWQSALDALRAQGAQRIDPVRLHFIEAMAQRLPAASAVVQPILERKLHAALAALGARVQQVQTEADDAQAPSPRAPAKAAASPAPTPLAELNRYIQQATQQEAVPVATGRPTRPARELKSVRRFRETWSKIAAVQQVDRALVRAPENAGPLNSHMLVLHSLALMRSLSPDYLQRFMSHVDTLLWIDQANQKPAPAEAKPKPAVKRSRAKK